MARRPGSSCPPLASPSDVICCGVEPAPGGHVNTRRKFLIRAPLGFLGVAAACRRERQSAAPASGTPPPAPPAGAPPTFGTAPAAGPAVAPITFAEAEKLVQVTMTPAEREMVSKSWRSSMASMIERRIGPRKVALERTLAPASRWDPMLRGAHMTEAPDVFTRTPTDPGPLPGSDEDIAFAPVTHLSCWIERKAITSQR